VAAESEPREKIRRPPVHGPALVTFPHPLVAFFLLPESISPDHQSGLIHGTPVASASSQKEVCEMTAILTGVVEGARAPATVSIVTRMVFAASPEQAWEALMFYEQIEERPPLLLRILLPAPIRAEGRKSRVGDDAICHYDGGYLVKRVTEIEPGRHFGFAVVAQRLDIGGGLRLAGGGYTLGRMPDGRTEVALSTRYVSPHRPRWPRPALEAAVCHMFHRHILGAMRRIAEAH
jgi:hypothetical protein